jgi:hypothetical protein
MTKDACANAVHAYAPCVNCKAWYELHAYQQKGDGLRWLSTSTDASSFFTWLSTVASMGPWITSASTST